MSTRLAEVARKAARYLESLAAAEHKPYAAELAAELQGWIHASVYKLWLPYYEQQFFAQRLEQLLAKYCQDRTRTRVLSMLTLHAVGGSTTARQVFLAAPLALVPEGDMLRDLLAEMIEGYEPKTTDPKLQAAVRSVAKKIALAIDRPLIVPEFPHGEKKTKQSKNPRTRRS